MIAYRPPSVFAYTPPATLAGTPGPAAGDVDFHRAVRVAVLDGRLSDTARRVYLLLLYMLDRTEYTNVSTVSLARSLSNAHDEVSDDAVLRALRSLETCGLIVASATLAARRVRRYRLA